MELMEYFELLDATYFGNTVEQYLIALGIFLGIVLAFRIFQGYVLTKIHKLTRKTSTDFDDLIIEVSKDLPAWFYSLIGLYFALQTLKTPSIIRTVVKVLTIVSIAYIAIRLLDDIIGYFIRKSAHKNDKEPASYYGFRLVIRILLWSTGLLLTLDNLGVNISALVASLGIGGIAVALAVQNILGDIFSSFSIYMDKPFEIGDYIVVGNHRGIVKKIGIKTTRMTSLDGEEIVISNQELTSTRIQNFRKLKKRRAVFHFGVKYNTAPTKMKKIPKMVKDIIKDIKKADIDRVHFQEFADSSLKFEVVYFVKSDVYKDYMDVQHKINMELLTKFNKENIEFAFPTRTVHVAKEG